MQPAFASQPSGNFGLELVLVARLEVVGQSIKTDQSRRRDAILKNDDRRHDPHLQLLHEGRLGRVHLHHLTFHVARREDGQMMIDNLAIFKVRVVEVPKACSSI